MNNVFFILASSSKSRLNLLNKIGYHPHKILSPDIDETWHRVEKPNLLSLRLAKQKCFKAYNDIILNGEYLNDIQNQGYNKIVILSADTVCASGAKIIDKALTDDDVKNCLTALSGKNHSVYTSIAVLCIDLNNKQNLTEFNIKQLDANIKEFKFFNIKKNLPNGLKFSSTQVHTRIKFKNLTTIEIDNFVKSGQGLNNAGGYTIGGIAESFIINLNGSYSSVIGLPTYQTNNILQSFGVKTIYT